MSGNKIYKYKLELKKYQEIHIDGRDVDILHIDLIDDEFFMWVSRFDDSHYNSKALIHIVGTGQEYENYHLRHLKTIKQGDLIWHFFVENVLPIQKPLLKDKSE